MYAWIMIAASCTASADTPQPPAFTLASTGARQVVVVTTNAADDVDGQLVRYTWSGEAFTPVGPAVPVVVGVHGLGWGRGLHPLDAGEPVKKEGDGRAPAGVFRLDTAMGYAADPPAGGTWPYRASGTSVCVDDVASAAYNRVVDGTTPKDWTSAETMARTDDLYRWLVVVDHNVDPAPVPGAGSCIFLHVWRAERRGTSGCTAMAEADLVAILGWLDPAARPVLVQLPTPDYARLRVAWGLP